MSLANGGGTVPRRTIRGYIQPNKNGFRTLSEAVFVGFSLVPLPRKSVTLHIP